jgi:HEAT repeat protein
VSRLVVAGLLILTAGCGARSTEHWIGRLKDPDVVKRREAIRELASRTADAERVVPALAEALIDENEYVRREAANALGRFGADARPALSALVTALSDREQRVRSAAAAAVRRIESETAKGVVK